jgi:hypothetical protein
MEVVHPVRRLPVLTEQHRDARRARVAEVAAARRNTLITSPIRSFSGSPAST